jgi:putative DNA primase/helicase
MSEKNEYCLEQGGLFYYSSRKKEEGDDAERRPLWLCSPITVAAMAKDEEGCWYKVIEFLDPDGDRVEHVIESRLLAKKDELWQNLLEKGLQIAGESNARTLLHTFLNQEHPEARAFIVSRLGWYEDDGMAAFVLPEGAVGKGSRRIIYRGGHNSYGIAGTTQDWIDKIGRYCAGNTRLVLAVSAVLASPLLYLTNEESGGIHVYGDSRKGKTTVGIVGTSVAGKPKDMMVLWRATSNGLEAIAESRCDGCLCLDEMGQVDPKEAGEIAYMLANGKGKQRMRRDTDARRSKEWRVLFISTGEITLSDKMTEAGKRMRAGQEVRLLDVPAAVHPELGIFENIHGFASPGEFAEHLKRAASATHGAVFRDFVGMIVSAYVEEPEGLKSLLRDRRDDFIREHLPAGASGQVRTACGRFGLVATAGEIASEAGLTGWEPGEATRAAVSCFKAWLEKRGTTGDGDLERGIQQVISYIERHGSSRFEDVDYHGNAGNRVGYRKRVSGAEGAAPTYEYFVLSQSWREELCKGYDPNAIAHEMVNRGLIIPQGKNQSPVSVLNRYGGRVYRLSPSIIAGAPDARTREERNVDFLAMLMSDGEPDVQPQARTEKIFA